MILPSIDLMNGKAVQLIQGKKKALERKDVLGLASYFSLFFEINVIDLDSAFEKGNNLGLIKEICRIAECRVGGGIKSIEKAKELISCGAKKVILGTKANKSFLKKLCKEIGREQIIVALDSSKGFVVKKGWTKSTKKTPFELVKELEPFCSEFLYTCVDREGLMNGADLKTIKQLRKLTENKLSAAGGISSLKEINELEKLGANSVLGMSLYTGKISLEEAFISQLEFVEGLIPTVVQDLDSRGVLMLAYSSKESLRKAFGSRQGWFFSRKQGRLWRKGETSGNTQELKRIRFDCDKDSLLFTVKQKGNACHTNSYSCFGEKELGITFLNELSSVIKSRKINPKKKSYTCKLFEKPEKIADKLKEETNELIESFSEDNKQNIVWETADLFYFLLVLLAQKNIELNDICRELKRRRK